VLSDAEFRRAINLNVLRTPVFPDGVGSAFRHSKFERELVAIKPSAVQQIIALR
jgi:hypothetical protein